MPAIPLLHMFSTGWASYVPALGPPVKVTVISLAAGHRPVAAGSRRPAAQSTPERWAWRRLQLTFPARWSEATHRTLPVAGHQSARASIEAWFLLPISGITDWRPRLAGLSDRRAIPCGSEFLAQRKLLR